MADGFEEARFDPCAFAGGRSVPRAQDRQRIALRRQLEAGADLHRGQAGEARGELRGRRVIADHHVGPGVPEDVRPRTHHRKQRLRLGKPRLGEDVGVDHGVLGQGPRQHRARGRDPSEPVRRKQRLSRRGIAHTEQHLVPAPAQLQRDRHLPRQVAQGAAQLRGKDHLERRALGPRPVPRRRGRVPEPREHPVELVAREDPALPHHEDPVLRQEVPPPVRDHEAADG